ncbi:hypothetical protein FV226_24585 [Methylobacterium sp. WL12]|uniref:hypothetical protein n=1 Tax=Methylobacterium sp. WL12 TaxID=2603890 RepID=UPI0011C87713|nr:hypothetical protein [Methylobacterium sp. WL12]TXM65672.1 hypothetical protein FV226_24585 [Methylobacterium sp. WL12]
MPTAEIYRGVRVFALQTQERINEVVKKEIDAVFAMSDAVALADYAGDASHSPEARLFAGARVEALWEMAAEGRAIRPPVDLARLRATTAGLDSLHWVSPWRHGSLFDLCRAIERKVPLTDAEIGR